MDRSELKRHIQGIEESYEFFLAYAAQGASGEAAERSDAQLREFLGRTDEALGELVDRLGALAEREGLTPAEPYDAMVQVVENDARAARAAVRLVLAQSSIGSELIDNLNASVHLRALLTDLFLLDEVL